ncbi:hypothetical protein L5515_019376 [Caenorhabditis briggsae]|uniref:Uncharacterized protein n=1 Tax=Caenorhabditis briggsae TaxID=6238 RepID=A0AAE9JTR8_CAEBR|nr:hypothetical protein L5515_019376 [Caenorhabditis briggsae]
MIGRIIWGWIMAVVDFFQPNRNNNAPDPPLIEDQDQEDQREVVDHSAMEPENVMRVVRNHDHRHEQLEAAREQHEAAARRLGQAIVDNGGEEASMRQREAARAMRQAIVVNDDEDGRIRRQQRQIPPRRRARDEAEARMRLREAARAMRQAIVANDDADDRIRRQQIPIPPRRRVPDRREMPIQQAIHRAQYAIEAQQEQQKKTECSFCNTLILNTEFVEHLTPCATEHGIVGTQKNLPLYNFLSNSWTLDQEFYKMRQGLEIEYLEACRDPSKISDMHCIKCPTWRDHNAGGCMSNLQKAAFLHHTDRILNLYMAHYEISLELKKDRGVEEINAKHIADFGSVEEYLNSNPVNLESEHSREGVRHETLEKQNVERDKFIQEEMDKNRAAYARMKEMVIRYALRKCSEMVVYLGQNKDRSDIGQVLAYRKCLRDEGYEAASRLERAEQGEVDDWFGGWRGERNEDVRNAGPDPEDYRWMENDEFVNANEELRRGQVLLDMWNNANVVEDDDPIIEEDDDAVMAEAPLNQDQPI